MAEQKVEKAVQSTLFKAPPRRLRMRHPPTPPPAPQRSKKSESEKS